MRGGQCDRTWLGPDQRFDRLLLAGLRLYLSTDAEAPQGSGPTYLVAKLPAEAVAELPSHADVELLPAEPDHVIVLVAIEPRVELETAEYCARYDDGSGDCVVAGLRSAQPERRRILPGHERVEAAAGGQLDASYHELQLVGPAPDEAPLELTLVLPPADKPAWEFVGADGVTLEPDALPSTRLELTLAPGSRAQLTVAQTLDSARLDYYPWFPPLIELPADPRLRALFDPTAAP